jgi:poly-gamma-glutamate synthesis protein (capsule biosynthesis protein)
MTARSTLSLFLCGDVMTGRGIDQILPHAGDPQLFESCVRSAMEYVELAELASGAIARPVEPSYVWGDALGELVRRRPDARIINLETSITARGEPWPDKGIHYRMHPANVNCLTALAVDCCVLANNHVMDFGAEGLVETLDTLRRAGIRTSGAGYDAADAALPAVIDLQSGSRVLVFAFAFEDSGAPRDWRAMRHRAGINLLEDMSDNGIERIARLVTAQRRAGDVVVVSLHWGGNWGFGNPRPQRRFAHALIERACVDVVHGHSSHHVKGIEVHRGRLVLYGCGDFLTDYEGIGGHEAYRGDLSLMYFPVLAGATGELEELAIVPMHMQRLRLCRATSADLEWLTETLTREGRALGTEVRRASDGSLQLRWSRATP